MQNVRQMLEAMEAGVSADAIFMQLVEGVNKSTANTIGIEIEMAIDHEEYAHTGVNERQLLILDLQWNRLVALQKAFAKDMADLKSKTNEYPAAISSGQEWQFSLSLLEILNELLAEANTFSDIIEEVQSIELDEEAELITTLLDGSNSVNSDALNFYRQVEDIIATLKEQEQYGSDGTDTASLNVRKELELVVKRLRNRYHCSLHQFNDSLTGHIETDHQLHSLMHPEPEEGANVWQEFRTQFIANGWEVKNDPSIKPYGLEAVTPDGGFAITDIARIKKGFAVAEKLHEHGWHFNETTGVHFHLGVNKNIDFFYIIAMIALFYQKESFIFANFPMRTKNRFAQSMENTVKLISAQLLRILETGGGEPAVEMADAELQEILDSLPKRQGTERYFGVNARPALTRHGTIELRYFHGQPLLDKPELLPKLIALFRSIMHEAQTSRYIAIPGAQKLMLERDAQDRVWIKSSLNRKEIPNKKLPIVPKYIAPKGTTLSVKRKGIDSADIVAKRIAIASGKKFTITSQELFAVEDELDLLFTQSNIPAEKRKPTWFAYFRPIMDKAIHFAETDNLLPVLIGKELHTTLLNTLGLANYVVVHNKADSMHLLRKLYDFLHKNFNILEH